MPKVLTNRRVQLVTGAALVLILTLAGTSIGFASVVHTSTAKANNFLATSISSKMLTKDGDLIANLHSEIDREPVPLDEIPLDLRNAAIATEDRRFYEHSGIDIRGTIRALIANIRGDRQGGSTITQQLAKNLYYHGEPRTMLRKASEAVLSLGLEQASSKDGILEAYLNTAYFGRGVYGVQAAARSYFRKPVQKLTLAESSFLVGLIHAPSRYDVVVTDDPAEQRQRQAAAMQRRDRVLDGMVDMGVVSKARALVAGSTPLELSPPRDPRWKHPYFVDAALRELGVLRNGGDEKPPARFDFLGGTHTERAQSVYRKGLRIFTTLDESTQENAEAALAEQFPSDVLPKASAALVSVEPGTGFVRALIGGRDYYPKGCDEESHDAIKPSCRHAKVNLALGAIAGGSGRQPGSSFKPLVLAAALEEGLSLKQTVDGSPFAYKYDTDTWKVANYEGSAGGTMSVVDATVKSVNAAYARLEIQFLGGGKGLKGSAKVANVARKLGIQFPTEAALRESCGATYGQNGGCTPADAVPAIALGAKEVSPLEMAGAYAAFANDGMWARPTLIKRIEDTDGKVLYDAKPEPRRAVSRTTALGVTHALQQVVQRGTGTAARLADRPVAGKTGTSQMWRDAWFDGYIPQMASVVWVGNPVPVQQGGRWTVESMVPANGYGIRVTGGSYPARIWNALMTRTVENMDVEAFADAPHSLFGPSKRLPKMDGAEELIGESGIAASMRLRREGRNVVVHRGCPPGGGGGGRMRVWKQEQRGDTTHIWRERAVC